MSQNKEATNNESKCANWSNKNNRNKPLYFNDDDGKNFLFLFLFLAKIKMTRKWVRVRESWKWKENQIFLLPFFFWPFSHRKKMSSLLPSYCWTFLTLKDKKQPNNSLLHCRLQWLLIMNSKTTKIQVNVIFFTHARNVEKLSINCFVVNLES